MQLREMFDRVDETLANDLSAKLKLAWLNDVERLVKEEVFGTHIMPKHDAEKAAAFDGYTEETPNDTELLVQDPYSVLYVYYLEAQIARANGDVTQQQDATTLFDNMYLTYRRFINRTCMPKTQVRAFLI